MHQQNGFVNLYSNFFMFIYKNIIVVSVEEMFIFQKDIIDKRYPYFP